jgi:hypothetical protein
VSAVPGKMIGILRARRGRARVCDLHRPILIMSSCASKRNARAQRRRTILSGKPKLPPLHARKRRQSALVERAIAKQLHLMIAAVPESKHLYGA